MEIAVHKAGVQTTLQDLGRPGRRAEGIPLGGAMDRFALRVANLLVGNPEDAPALEVTLTGPVLEFSDEAWVGVCGARFDGVPAWRPFRMGPGERLRFGKRSSGCRAYVAVAGGFKVEPVLGGYCTFLAAGLGGHMGRALRDGDVLTTLPARRVPTGRWWLDEKVFPRYSPEAIVRALPGRNASEFGNQLFEGRYIVTPRSNRMGLRLTGHTVERLSGEEQLSAAVTPGTVQVPADGDPIILSADAQTLGGYPRAAHVVTADLPVVAQLAPGDAIRFTPVTVDEAHGLLAGLFRQIGLLRQGLGDKMRPV